MRRVVAGLMLLAASPPAVAAVAPCAHPKSGREQAVCSDPKLAVLDGDVSRAYDAAMAGLSSDGGTLLHGDQRNWLAAMDRLCPAGPGGVKGIAACLSERYAQRAAQLRQAEVKIGPYMFSRLDRFSVNGPGPNDAAPFLHHVARPRIDMPQTAATAAWNRQARRANKLRGDCEGDTDVDYRIGLANERAISLLWTASNTCRGTVRGSSDYSGQTIVLMPRVHALRPDDLFRPGADWGAALADAAIRQAGAPGQPSNGPGAARIINEVARDPGHWFLTQAGLSLLFEPEQLPTRAIVVPWASLTKVLGSDLLPEAAGNTP